MPHAIALYSLQIGVSYVKQLLTSHDLLDLLHYKCNLFRHRGQTTLTKCFNLAAGGFLLSQVIFVVSFRVQVLVYVASFRGHLSFFGYGFFFLCEFLVF